MDDAQLDEFLDRLPPNLRAKALDAAFGDPSEVVGLVEAPKGRKGRKNSPQEAENGDGEGRDGSRVPRIVRWPLSALWAVLTTIMAVVVAIAAVILLIIIAAVL